MSVLRDGDTFEGWRSKIKLMSTGGNKFWAAVCNGHLDAMEEEAGGKRKAKNLVLERRIVHDGGSLLDKSGKVVDDGPLPRLFASGIHKLSVASQETGQKKDSTKRQTTAPSGAGKHVTGPLVQERVAELERERKAREKIRKEQKEKDHKEKERADSEAEGKARRERARKGPPPSVMKTVIDTVDTVTQPVQTTLKAASNIVKAAEAPATMVAVTLEAGAVAVAKAVGGAEDKVEQAVGGKSRKPRKPRTKHTKEEIAAHNAAKGGKKSAPKCPCAVCPQCKTAVLCRECTKKHNCKKCTNHTRCKLHGGDCSGCIDTLSEMQYPIPRTAEEAKEWMEKEPERNAEHKRKKAAQRKRKKAKKAAERALTVITKAPRPVISDNKSKAVAQLEKRQKEMDAYEKEAAEIEERIRRASAPVSKAARPSAPVSKAARPSAPVSKAARPSAPVSKAARPVETDTSPYSRATSDECRRLYNAGKYEVKCNVDAFDGLMRQHSAAAGLRDVFASHAKRIARSRAFAVADDPAVVTSMHADQAHRHDANVARAMSSLMNHIKDHEIMESISNDLASGAFEDEPYLSESSDDDRELPDLSDHGPRAAKQVDQKPRTAATNHRSLDAPLKTDTSF
jgi:hypothetical protein